MVKTSMVIIYGTLLILCWRWNAGCDDRVGASAIIVCAAGDVNIDCNGGVLASYLPCLEVIYK